MAALVGGAGLSPQVRGTAVSAFPWPRGRRFIPAGAGNSAALTQASRVTPVYPRRCGEQASTGPRNRSSHGLSPQVRGTAGRPGALRPFPRFIPAGAGNSAVSELYIRLDEVYPRRCGEQVLMALRSVPSSGLSPQVRGTGGYRYPHRRCYRFIPAGAGNRRRSRRTGYQTAVYPRRCGEQTRHRCLTEAPDGLSPQVRGTDRGARAARRGYRFIPAGAGNRLRTTRCRDSPTVYPRRCGEQLMKSPTRSCMSGLSPQVRGTGSEVLASRNSLRFIPAGAGNSFVRRCAAH